MDMFDQRLPAPRSLAPVMNGYDICFGANVPRNGGPRVNKQISECILFATSYMMWDIIR